MQAPKLEQLRIRDSLPKASVMALILCALVAIWATHEVTMNEENLQFKAIAEECEGFECQDNDAKIWTNVWDRTVRMWLFSVALAGFAIVKIEPLSIGDDEE